MAVNKVVFGAVAIMDITDSTVTKETLVEGVTAYDKSGDKITGTMKPVGEPLENITAKDTLLWDGNTEGKTVFDMTGDGSYTYYPVSENVLSLNDLANGMILESSGMDGVPFETIKLTDFAKMSNKIIASRSVSSVLFVLEDNAPLYAGTIPKKGIYFLRSEQFGYVSRIQIEGYTGFSTDIKAITVEGGTSVHVPSTGKYVDKDIIITATATDTDPVLQEKTVTPTTSQQNVTPDSGYDGLSKVTVNAMPTATQATPSITVSSSGLITAKSTQSAGYVASGTKSATKQLTVQAGKTVTPTTSNQTAVASGRYTTGAITVKGDANLKAENIKSGVSIFGVTGSYAGSTEDLDSVITELENKVATLNTTLDGKASGGGSVEICTVTFIVGGSGIDYLCATIMSGGRFDTCFYNGSGINSENSMIIENVVCGTPIAICAAVPIPQVSFSDGGELIDMGNAFFTIKAPTVAGANTTISIVPDM